MSKTLITWPHGSVDGEREARRLQALYATVSDCVDGSGLAAYPAGQHSRLIVVGHREEIEKLDTLKALVACVRSLVVTTVVMANCNSGQYKSGAALSDGNELWEPAQRVANGTNTEVAATLCVLLFDEVGKGYGFGPSDTDGISPINPDGKTLWKSFRKQDEVDELADGLGRL